MNVLLVGNPNCGKTSLFNLLTGLNQKVGNYPGITVEKRSGSFTHLNCKIDITDLPGIYSLYPGSEDERIAVQSLLDIGKEDNPLVVCLIDIQTPHKNLLLLSQMIEFGLPMVGVLNYRKKSSKEEIAKWKLELETKYQIPFAELNASTGKGVDSLRQLIVDSKERTALINEKTVDGVSYNEWIERSIQRPSTETVKIITKDLRERLEDIDSSFAFHETNDLTKNLSEKQKGKSSQFRSA